MASGCAEVLAVRSGQCSHGIEPEEEFPPGIRWGEPGHRLRSVQARLLLESVTDNG